MATEKRQPDTVHLETEQQIRALSNVTRHRIWGLLADGPATITQLAARLGVLKGSASYHIRILEEAGVIHVVRTRKVRGVHERYYDRAARRITFPGPAPGEPDVLMRNMVADLEASPSGPRTVLLRHLRLDDQTFDEFSRRLEELVDELATHGDPGAPAADLGIAFFRPERPRPGGAETE